jgi:hypothetical protein
MPHGFARYSGLAGVAAVAVALSLVAPASAGLASVGRPAFPSAGPPLAHPATGTPHFKAVTKRTEQIRQLVQCGGTMYAVGTFSQILQGNHTYNRNNVFSFSATPPFTVTSWDPNVNGEVNSIALTSDCKTAYLGGRFSKVAGSTANDIAAVAGAGAAAFDSGFKHAANGQVETLLLHGSHLLAGGYYKVINGSSANPYMTSLNAATGSDDGFLHLGISGNYKFKGVSKNPTRVYNQALSHSVSRDLVMGDFTSAGGKKRQQIFMLDLSGSHASVTGWTSPQFDGSNKHYDYQCGFTESFYIQAAAWSPDDSTIYIGDTGYKPWNQTTKGTRRGLCDAAAAFPATQKSVTSKWINYTGCDSLFAAAADSSTAYFAGHERWSQNPNGCDHAGPGAKTAPGFEGLSPSSGKLTFNPTRARGFGADDMLVTGAGLWIASDNAYGSQMCGHVQGLAGICFLKY